MKKIILAATLFLLLTLFSYAGNFSENTKFKGDFKVFYEMIDKKENALRHRERMRLRYGFDTKINEKVSITARLATGGANARSTNQSFENVFQTKAIGVDIAYIKYEPYKDMKFLAGKLPNKVINSKDDLLWDTDITFEGQALCLKKDIAVLRGGLFVLDEISENEEDPYFTFVQPCIKKNGNALSYDLGCAYYSFINVSSTTVGGSNTISCFDTINPNLSLKYAFPDNKYAVSVIGNYVYNDYSKDEGYLLGTKLGFNKVKEKGSWQIYYNWRYLEKEAFPDVFPDASAYGGRTNAKGHEIIMKYALMDKVCASLDYYIMSEIIDPSKTERLLQTNLEVKF